MNQTRLSPNETIALAQVMNRLTDDEISRLLTSSRAWNDYQTARTKISNAADDAIHASQSSRRAL